MNLLAPVLLTQALLPQNEKHMRAWADCQWALIFGSINFAHFGGPFESGVIMAFPEALAEVRAEALMA
ncbi:MAG: hypothetical protein R3B83_03710 [Nitrospirales bacterium]|nr:hypothetical protein [Nitrospirales bacterium]